VTPATPPLCTRRCVLIQCALFNLTGKTFHEKLKALQKEVDSERARLSVETTSSSDSAASLQAALAETQAELVRLTAENTMSSENAASLEANLAQVQSELEVSRLESDGLKSKVASLEAMSGASQESGAAAQVTRENRRHLAVTILTSYSLTSIYCILFIRPLSLLWSKKLSS
jgi:chromosome segregation ATPase